MLFSVVGLHILKLNGKGMKITIDTSAYTVQKIVEDGELDTRDKKLARQILTKQIEFFNSLLPEANEIDKETIIGKRDLMIKARREV